VLSRIEKNALKEQKAHVLFWSCEGFVRIFERDFLGERASGLFIFSVSGPGSNKPAAPGFLNPLSGL